MKKILKYLPIFSVAAASAQLSAAPEQAQTPTPPPPPPNFQPKINDILRFGKENYIVVFKFTNFPQYEEFQHNANIMKQSYMVIEKLSENLKSETDEKAKKDLSAKIEQLKRDFDANDKTMREGYNFSSARQYKVLFSKTNICLPLSDEEMSLFQRKDGSKIDPKNVVKASNGKHFIRWKTILGIHENDEFQLYLRRTVGYKLELKKMRDQLSQSTKSDEITSLSEKIANFEKALKESEKILNEKYGLESGKNYLVEVENSDLLMLLTPEEVLQIQAKQQNK